MPVNTPAPNQQVTLLVNSPTPPVARRPYWYHNPQNQFPPPALREPEQYTGGDRLSIVCTQTDLPAKAQKDLVRRWCKALPGLGDVRTVWFHSRVTQELFDAACAMPQLEGLYVKWSGITSLDALTGAPQLRYFHLGTSPGVTSIACFEQMPQLRWLDLENLKLITDLTPLAALAELEGLSYVGGDGKALTVASFAPLAQLKKLWYLHLGALRAADDSLLPLANLTHLRELHLPIYSDWRQFAWLAGALPDTASPRFQPGVDIGRNGIRCKRCTTTGIMILNGAGLRQLCPTCDAKRWEKFKSEFEAVVAQARAERAE